MFWQLLKNEELLGESFSIPFTAKCVYRDFKYLF